MFVGREPRPDDGCRDKRMTVEGDVRFSRQRDRLFMYASRAGCNQPGGKTMKLKLFTLILLIVFCLIHPAGQADGADLSIKVAPGMNFPVGRDTDVYTISGGMDVQASLNLPFLHWLTVGADVGYGLAPLKKPEGTLFSSLSVISGGVVVAADFEVLPKFNLLVFGNAGAFYALFNEEPSSGGANPYAGIGLGASYRLLPSLSLSFACSYRNFLGLYNDARVTLASTLHMGPGVEKFRVVRAKNKSKAAHTRKGQGVEISSVEYSTIFPVFFKYYDRHPIGRATLKNWEEVPVENVRTSLFVKQYMDNPKWAETIDRLDPGEEKAIDIYGLFTNNVLDITEGTSVSALLSVTYMKGGKEARKEHIQTIRLENRNAVTWDDNRKACAFVTAKDPVVLKFAKNVAGIIKDMHYEGVDKNMVLAIALHETLDLYGVTSAADPNTPYVDFSKRNLAIDYLQFPKQTLEFMAGDCDDLSILYSSLLEAVGVETAFVTTPGHIFVAFVLSATPSAARGQYLYPDNLIVEQDRAWLPVEITTRGRGFVEAWKLGAKEWRENESKDLRGFFPMHEGWELYEPVGLPAAAAITMPAKDQIISRFQNEVEGFIESELSHRVRQLQAELETQKGNPNLLNKIGVLYAKYGLYDKALESFEEILSNSEYVPALVNSGNIYFLRKEMQLAKSYFERAVQVESDNPKVLLCVAKVNHELENFSAAREAYSKLTEIAPAMAERFIYLSSRAEEGSRASDLEEAKGAVLWDED